MKTIATITLNPSVDQASTLDRVIPEKKLRCTEPVHEPGGGGINVSRAIRNLGGDSLALYTSGGHAGQTLQFLLDAEGITHRPVEIDGWTRSNLIVLEETSRLQYRFGMPGPILTDIECERMLFALKNLDNKPDYIVASGSLPRGVPSDFYAKVAEISRGLGSRLVVDTSGEPLKAVMNAGAFLLKPNLRELMDLTGEKFQNEAQLEVAARQFLAEGDCHAIVVSLGAGGGLLATRDGCHRFVTPTVPVNSKVGAGDSTVAGTVLALTRGMSLPEAVMFGLAAGSAAVMNKGTELCRRDDAERLFAEIKARAAMPGGGGDRSGMFLSID